VNEHNVLRPRQESWLLPGQSDAAPPTTWTTPPETASSLSTRNFRISLAFYILLRHWRASVLFMAVLCGLVLFVVRQLHDTYSPVAHVEVNAPESLAFSAHETPFSDETRPDYMETQIEILKSSELALTVIKALRLDSNPDFMRIRQPDAIRGAFSRLLNPGAKVQRPTETEQALRTFQQHLSINQVRNSKLIAVSFSSHDPVFAATITNRLVHNYIELNFADGYHSTMKAAQWLSAQLEELHRKVQASDQALVDYQRQKGIPVDLSNKDSENPTAVRVNEFNHQLAQAEVDRIQGKAGLDSVQPGHEDAAPQVRDSDLAKELRKRLADAHASLAQAETLLGANHPSMQKLTNEIHDLESELAAERARVLEQMQTAYDAARLREKFLSQLLDRSKIQLGDLNEKMIRYRTLKSQAQADEELYNTLYARLQEAGITAGLKSTNLRIVGEARVLDTPTRPDRKQMTLLGLLVSIFGGASLAFVLEAYSDAINSVDVLRNLTPVPISVMPLSVTSSKKSLGQLSVAPKQRSFPGPDLFLDRPRSPELEGVRNLCTFVTCGPGARIRRVLVIASAGSREGKTTIALNLAAALSQQARICLVEADLRKPGLTIAANLQTKKGLRDLLTGAATLDETLHQMPDNLNLTVVPAGNEHNDDTLVDWTRMRHIVRDLANRFDYVIIDAPPLIPFADARVLATLADGVLLVARCGFTTRHALAQSIEILETLQAVPLGVILNGVGRDSPSHKYYAYEYA
jgi:succinoglycan biosynthesis transport protein ExoP